MRAAVFQAPGEPLAIEQVAEPVPEPSDLIVAVRASGICGSDLHMTDVADTRGGMTPLPRGAILGHEFAGEVVEVGRSARGEWRIGERVCALPYIGCGACAQCLSGRGHRCAEVIYGGLGRLAGAYAEFVRVGSSEALRLPEGIDFRGGALVEPLAVGLHAVRAANLQAGESVLVVGAGPVGLAVTLWCRFRGARHVVVSDLVARRAELAANFGATAAIDASLEDVIGSFKRLAGARPDVVFDCVGVPGTQQLCMNYAPTDGRIVVVGVCMQPDQVIPVKAVTKELQVNYAFMYTKQDFELVIDLLGRRRIDADAMVTDVVGFVAFADAFQALKRPTSQCNVMLAPD